MTDAEKLTILAQELSALGGVVQAQNAAICALLRAYATGQPLPEALYEHLEKTYSGVLGGSVNPHVTASFEETRALLLLAAGIKEQDGPSGPPAGD